jgi:mono/diheme cytochrome c family protein
MDDLAPELRPKAVAIATFVRAQDPEAAQRLDPAVVAAGKAAYLEAECNACHPLTPGEADLGPNLAGYGTADWLMRFLQDPGHELFYAEDNQMPAYQDELSREELQALVIYLRTLDGDPPELPDSK